MSKKNVELIRRYFASPGDLIELFGNEDRLAGIRAEAENFVHADFHMPAGAVGRAPSAELQIARGIDGFIEAWRDMITGWETLRADIDQLREIDAERVLALGTARGRTKHGSVEVEIPTAAIYHFRDDRLWRIEYYTTQADALEAADIDE